MGRCVRCRLFSDERRSWSFFLLHLVFVLFHPLISHGTRLTIQLHAASPATLPWLFHPPSLTLRTIVGRLGRNWSTELSRRELVECRSPGRFWGSLGTVYGLLVAVSGLLRASRGPLGARLGGVAGFSVFLLPTRGTRVPLGGLSVPSWELSGLSCALLRPLGGGSGRVLGPSLSFAVSSWGLMRQS